ncbi:hypothetical protein E3P86_02832 [Wallemia ichthyophaga]|uniref:Mei2-like C-terminal RNA recognition motif domain-containing protein n=1 Tax=Wallemia ichthyophaga TaxID=245174 RepID=A0A4T0IZX8_WALIC|nr:hypothetical protein E3P86_02832 [Wallemia ichthyophaga]
MSTREIASLGMAFRRWSFSGNDDGNSSDVVTAESPLSPASAMRFSYTTEGCPHTNSIDGTVETSLQSEAELLQSRFLRVDSLSGDLSVENVQSLFSNFTNMKAINISNLSKEGFVILAFFTYSDAHDALVDLGESKFKARLCTESEINETTDAKRYINSMTSGKLSVRLHKEAQRPVLDLLETIGRVAKYQHILLQNDQVLLQIEYDDTRHAMEADKALGQSRYDVEKTWNHSVLESLAARNKAAKFKERKLQPFEGAIPNLDPQSNLSSFSPQLISSTTRSLPSSIHAPSVAHESSYKSAKSQRSHTPERNQIDLGRIERGEDTRTTVMIKNIPNRLTTDQLEKYISDVVPRSFDFLYLRMDFKSRSNVGYAFVNFLTVDELYKFASMRINYKWDVYHSEKRMGMTYANVQGKEALTAKFRNSVVMEEEPGFRPLVYYSSGVNIGIREDFPIPNNEHRLARSRVSARSYGLYNIQAI